MAKVADKVMLRALRLLKAKEAGETLGADLQADGIELINEIFENWNTQYLMQDASEKITQALTAGDGSYTFGTSGDNSTRPQIITKAFVRTTSNLDYPINIISSDQYSEIWDKTIQSSWPIYLYYRKEWPLGVVELWPLPDTAYTLHLEVMPSFPSISLGSDSIDLAPNYIKALEYELAYMWAPEFKLHDSFPLIKEGMLDAQAWVKRINAQDRPVMESPVKYVGNRAGSGFFLT